MVINMRCRNGDLWAEAQQVRGKQRADDQTKRKEREKESKRQESKVNTRETGPGREQQESKSLTFRQNNTEDRKEPPSYYLSLRPTRERNRQLCCRIRCSSFSVTPCVRDGEFVNSSFLQRGTNSSSSKLSMLKDQRRGRREARKTKQKSLLFKMGQNLGRIPSTGKSFSI